MFCFPEIKLDFAFFFFTILSLERDWKLPADVNHIHLQVVNQKASSNLHYSGDTIAAVSRIACRASGSVIRVICGLLGVYLQVDMATVAESLLFTRPPRPSGQSSLDLANGRSTLNTS